jgi:trehalose 2-sulfotransferase
VATPQSYLVCGTPRTGSTLLCDLLASTGVAGRPESYFREPDQHAWARRFGVVVEADGAFDYAHFVTRAMRAGMTPNGVFGARVMWGTMPLIVDGLRSRRDSRRDLDVLVDALGPLLLVHLKRGDVVGQAVSWARAEQTGFWQRGDLPSAEPDLDIDQVDSLVRTIAAHNAGWEAWFAEQDAKPYVLSYEEVVADPRTSVQRILRHLGLETPPGWRPQSPHHRQSDAINADWARRYRDGHGQPR